MKKSKKNWKWKHMYFVDSEHVTIWLNSNKGRFDEKSFRIVPTGMAITFNLFYFGE